MKFYIEITLLPGADIDLHYLWSKIYQQIHLSLVEIQDHNGNVPVGISLPEYNEQEYQLGSKLRLFASEESVLNELNIKAWIKSLHDYVHLTSIRPVPKTVKNFAVYSRKQINRSQSKLKRIIKRKAIRDGISIEEAGKFYHDSIDCLGGKYLQNDSTSKNGLLKQPFINIKSLSTGEHFRMFIEKKIVSENSINMEFNTYGLNKNSKVPEF